MPSVFDGIGKALQERGLYNTWMYEEQDHIQNFAKAYADRIICGSFLDVLAQDDVRGSDSEEMLTKVCQLHLLSTLERDLPWFVENGHISIEQAAEVRAYVGRPNASVCSIIRKKRFADISLSQVLDLNRGLCAEVAPHALSLIETFDLPEDLLAAPIARDWVKFNEGDNQGELATKEEFQKILREA